MAEKPVGKVIHFYDKISVGIIRLTNKLAVGDKIHVKGAHDDFEQTVDSMQIEHGDIKEAKKGAEVGIKVGNKVHENDKVFLVKV